MMSLRRLAPAVVLAFLTCTPTVSHAEDYPTRPVRIIVGFGPGAANDITARLLAPHLSQTLGQPFIVENRAGGASNIAASAVARSEKDGHTLFMCTSTNVTNAVLGKTSGYDFMEDLTPITVTSRTTLLLVVNPSLGVSSVKELIALAQSEQKPLFFGTSGVGGTMHLTGELFNMRTGSKIVHVPYQSTAAAMTDLIAGRLQLMFSPASTALPFIESGQVKALAVVAPARMASVPDLPTMQELGFSNFDSGLWDCLMTPKGTPRSTIEKLSSAVNAALQNPEVIATIKRQGGGPGGGSLEDTGRLVETEFKKWHAVAAALGLAK